MNPVKTLLVTGAQTGKEPLAGCAPSKFKRVNTSSNSSGQVSKNSSHHKSELQTGALGGVFAALGEALKTREVRFEHSLEGLNVDVSNMLRGLSAQHPSPWKGGSRLEAWVSEGLELEPPELAQMLEEFRFENLSHCLKNIGYSLQFSLAHTEEGFRVEYTVSGKHTSGLKMLVESVHWLSALKYCELRLASLVCATHFQRLVSSSLGRAPRDAQSFLAAFRKERGVKLVSDEEIRWGELQAQVEQVEWAQALQTLFDEGKYSSLVRKLWRAKYGKKLKVLKIVDSDDEDSDEERPHGRADLATFTFLSGHSRVFETKCHKEALAAAKEFSALLLLSKKFPAECAGFLQSGP